MDKYLVGYIKSHSNNELTEKYADYLKVDLDGYIYAYGDNMKKDYPVSRNYNLTFWKDFLKTWIRTGNTYSFIGKGNNVLSFVGMPDDINKSYNYNFLGSFVQPIGANVIKTKALVDLFLFYSRLVRSRCFNEVLTSNNCQRLEALQEAITKDYSHYNFRGLFVGNAVPFILKSHIEIFKKLNRPSFTFLHGLPGIYDLEDEKKVDYLCVWGDQIKENYVKAGFDKSQIYVIGNRKYANISSQIELSNNFDRILVATTASVNWSPCGWNYFKFPLNDRSLIVLYCYSIQNVLEKLGVHRARLRVHPSVNKEWIMKFVDRNFYTIDTKPLDVSLKESSLVIGPTSTVWLQSLIAGVNYLVYEPSSDGKRNLFNEDLVPPFDGSDEYLKVAFSEEDLLDMLKSKYLPNTKIIEKYIRPFDFGIVDKLLKQ